MKDPHTHTPQNIRWGAREVTQRLRECSDLLEDLSLVPSTQVRGTQCPITLAAEGSDASGFHKRMHSQVHVHTHMCAHTHTELKTIKINL